MAQPGEVDWAEVATKRRVAREQAVMDVLSEWYGHVGLRCVREILAALAAVDALASGVEGVPMANVKVGDWVEFDVPYVEGIGPGYTARGYVDRADPGHMLILRPCTDGKEHWRSCDKVRRVASGVEGDDGTEREGP